MAYTKRLSGSKLNGKTIKDKLMKLSCKKTATQKHHDRRKLYSRLCEEVGDRVTRTKFLWFPKQLYNQSRDCLETRWLEKASFIEEFKYYPYMRAGASPNEKPGKRYIFVNDMFEWVEMEWVRNDKMNAPQSLDNSISRGGNINAKNHVDPDN